MKKLKFWHILVICFVLLSQSAKAQNYERISEYEQNLYDEFVYVNGDYETMKAIRRYWQAEQPKIKNRNCEYVLCGNAESVLKITIPSRLLFAPGDSTVSVHADAYLRPILRYIRGAEAMNNCIISCYSDNNGSEKYLKNMTRERANAIYSWFLRQGVPAANMRSFGIGDKVNRTNNDNIKNRERNRRVAIFLIPNKKMLKAAKKSQL